MKNDAAGIAASTAILPPKPENAIGASENPPNPGTLIGLHLDESRPGYWAEFTRVCVFLPTSSQQAAEEIVLLAGLALAERRAA